MSEGTHGLIVTERAASPKSVGRCYVSANAYPLTVPYKNPHRDAYEINGKMPRIVSILFNTLVVVPNEDYDAESRTMSFGRLFRSLCLRLHMCAGGRANESMRRLLRSFNDITFYKDDGTPVKPIENLVMPERGLSGIRVTFTEDYVRLMLDNPREMPLSTFVAVSSSAVQLDLLVLAVLYCPEDRKLIIQRDELPSIMPMVSPQTLAPAKLNSLLVKLNQIQDRWTFRLGERNLSICPADMWEPNSEALVLRRI